MYMSALARVCVCVQLFVIDNCIGDWRIAMSFRSISQIIVELLICSIHPVPGSFYFTWRLEHADGETVTTAQVPVDLVVSLPMFLRFYLVCRGAYVPTASLLAARQLCCGQLLSSAASVCRSVCLSTQNLENYTGQKLM